MRPEKRVSRTQPSPMEQSMALTDMGYAKTDPQGSWTGVPDDPYEVPVQDVDDL